ncbi:Signal transduction histidine kinase [Granulicella rosea]|uniref:Signal transduction histidine kinase n=1 Tax=Granulicella rosea TaxID=474952 RepID=A0A239M160_9BACT|nr:sensor histidine kinase [Granulicella rosea]SNT36466.1 Signal transduction histidine kinase [Granulicella rosea]
MRTALLFVWQVLLMGSVLRGEPKKTRAPFLPEMIPHVAHVGWTERDGAPLNIVAIAQTDDGYLWVGSPFGLYRFDGVTFASYPVTPLDAPLPVTNVGALSSDGQGGLWIGYDHGGISHLTRTGALVNYNPENGRGPNSASKFILRPDGSVWCLGDNKVLVLDGDRWVDFGSKSGLTHNQYLSLFFDSRGDLWTSARGKLYVLRHGETHFSLYPMKSFIIVDLAEAPDGRIWISDGWRSVHPLDSETKQIPTNGYVRIVEADGTLWMAQDYKGVSHVRQTQSADRFSELVKEKDMSAEQTNAIFRDRDGSIWVGTSKGLDRFRPSVLRKLTNAEIEYYPSLARDASGMVWVGVLSHPVAHSEGGGLTAVGPWVGSSPMIADDAKRLWLVDPFLNAIFCYGPNGVTHVPIPADVHGVPAQSIGLDRDGAVLVSFDGGGLWRFDGVWRPVVDMKLPLDEDPISIFRDPSGKVWFGYTGKVAMLDGAGFHLLNDARIAGFGSFLTFAMSHGRLWAGGSQGVAYFDQGSFHSVVLQRGGTLKGVSGIVEDEAGNLWFNASVGIVRLKAEDVDEALRGRPVDYDLLDQRRGVEGVATQLRPTPSAVAGMDGLLWFARLGTVFTIQAAQFSPSAAAPIPLIEGVSLNGVAVRDREHQTAPLAIGAAHLRGLEFDYASLDLIAAETLRYEYMLAGEDKGWQEAGSRRQAFYSRLGPGAYQFHVRVSSAKGQWVELSAPLLLTIRPEFYQTLWFRALVAVLALTLLYALYLARIGYVTGQLRERLQVRAGERLRIARELHDTLLQSIHGLMLRVHFATDTLPEDDAVRSSLQHALKSADSLILEGRRRVQDLREEIPEEGELTVRIVKVAEELELEKLCSFRLVEEGSPRKLQPEIQSELCRIAREALRNARYHSQASVVEVKLIYEAAQFLMKCCDNGVGMPPSIVATGNRPGHWGLASMRERTNVIGGQLQVWSSAESGTEVIVKLPARKVYEAPAARWITLLRALHLVKQAAP